MYNDQANAAPVQYGAASSNAIKERQVGVLDNLREAVNGMHELKSRLSQLNRHIRGAIPQNTAKEVAVPSEASLVSYMADLHSLLRECHDEISQAYNHLGV